MRIVSFVLVQPLVAEAARDFDASEQGYEQQAFRVAGSVLEIQHVIGGFGHDALADVDRVGNAIANVIEADGNLLGLACKARAQTFGLL